MLKDIQIKINSFPNSPGIYFMKDKEGNIIYVGKSKNLQNRIKSYFVKSNTHSKKTKRLVKCIYDIEIITTDTELDALLLECEMIKKIRPIYNKIMKNHENYAYLKIDSGREYAYIEVVDEVSDNSLYFGPYIKINKLDEVKGIINETLKLRQCKKMTKCFNYDLNKCVGPCRNTISKDEYKVIINNVISDLKGEETNIIDILKDTMQKEIGKLNFEKASKIQDSINKIKSIINRQEIINSSIKDEKIFAWIKLNEYEYKLYVIKRGKLIKSEKVSYDTLKIMDKYNYLENTLIENKDAEIIQNNNKIINKFDIDFINIIYNYIKYNKDIDYISK